MNREFTGKCTICGAEMSSPAWGPGDFHDVCSKCHGHRFWDIIVEEKDTRVIVNGKVYCQGPERNMPNSWKGFGGALFQWVMLDDPSGTIHKSTNMWFNGEIPASHRAQLPDNARWVE